MEKSNSQNTHVSQVVVPAVPDLLRKALNEKRCVLFAGAGFSVDAGAPTWKGLFQEILNGNDLKNKHNLSDEYINGFMELFNDKNYLDLASALSDSLSSYFLREHLRSKFSNLKHTSLHETAMRVGFRAVITTNYDKLFEQAFNKINGLSPRLCIHEDILDIADLARSKDFFIFKIHGDIDRASSVVLCQEEYQNMLHRNQHVQEFFKQILATNTVLFAGYGLSDPDILMWMGNFQSIFTKDTARNYILTPSANPVIMKRYLSNYNIQPLVYGTKIEDGKEKHLGLHKFFENLATTSGKISEDSAPENIPEIASGQITDDEIRKDYFWKLRSTLNKQENLGIGGGQNNGSLVINRARVFVTPNVVREATSFLSERELEVDQKKKSKLIGDDNFFVSEDKYQLIYDGENGFGKKVFGKQKHFFLSRTHILNSISVSKFLTDNSEVVLLGDPGSGKSLLCRILPLLLSSDKFPLGDDERNLWSDFSAKLKGYTPFYFLLRRTLSGHSDSAFGAKKITAHIADFIEAEHLLPNNCSKQRFIEFIENEFNQGRGFFIFDGLDEAGDDINRSNISMRIHNFFHSSRGDMENNENRLLLTSRVVGYAEAAYPGTVAIATIAPFGKSEIRKFFYYWPCALDPDLRDPEKEGKRRWDDFQGKAAEHQKIWDMASTPIILTIIASIQGRGVVLPEQRVILYSEASKTLFETWEHARAVASGCKPGTFAYSREATKKILCRLALEMTLRDITSISRKELKDFLEENLSQNSSEGMLSVKNSVEIFLQEVRKQAPILTEYGTRLENEENWSDMFAFIHKSFQEYLAAIAVLGRQDREKWIKEHAFDHGRFSEIIALIVGELALNLNDSAQTSLILGAILQADGYPREAVRLANLKLAVRCFGEDFDLGSFEKLLLKIFWRQFRSGWLENRELFIPVFQELFQSSRCREKLLDKTNNAFRRLGEKWPAYIKVLSGALDNPDVKKRLQLALRDSDPSVRSSASKALSSAAGQPDEQKSLQMILKYSDWNDRKRLPEGLRDSDSSVRVLAAIVLSSVAGQPDVQKLLLKSLEDSDRIVRSLGAKALSPVAGQLDAQRSLLNALEDSDFGVRSSAARALSSAADQPDVQRSLLKVITDTDLFVTSSVASALSSVAGQPDVQRSLVKLLENSDSDVRSSAAKALSQVAGQPDVQRLLLKALEDSDLFVRSSAARALSSAAGQPDVRRSLLKALEGSDSSVRSSAVMALSSVSGQPDVQRSLLKALDDSNISVRLFAAIALLSVPVLPGVQRILLSALEDSDFGVRSLAASGLLQIIELSQNSEDLEKYLNEKIQSGNNSNLEKYLLLNIHAKRFPEKESRDFIFSLLDDPLATQAFIPKELESHCLTLLSFKYLTNRISQARFPYLSKELLFKSDIPYYFSDFKQRKKYLFKSAELELRKSPLNDFSDGRNLLKIFFELEKLLPLDWESPTLNAYATAFAGEFFLETFLPDQYKPFDHWQNEILKSFDNPHQSTSAIPTKSELKISLKRGWWMSAFLAELGSLIGPFISDKMRKTFSPNDLQLFCELLKLDLEPKLNKTRFTNWLALTKRYGIAVSKDHFEKAWKEVRSSDYSLSEAERPSFDLLGMLYSLGSLSPYDWNLTNPVADYPACEVNEALIFQQAGCVEGINTSTVGGKWFPALLTICRGLNIYGGAYPLEPHPPTVEIRNAVFGKSDEVLLESCGAKIAFDFRYVPPEGSLNDDDDEKFEEQCTIVEKYREQRFHNLRRLLEKITVESTCFPFSRLYFHADAVSAEVFDFESSEKTLPINNTFDSKDYPLPEKADISRVKKLSDYVFEKNWSHALDCLQNIDDESFSRQINDIIVLLASDENESLDLSGASRSEFILALLPFCRKEEQRTSLLSAVQKILKNKMSSRLLTMLYKVFRHLDGNTRKEFYSFAVNYLSDKTKVEPDTGAAILDIIPLFFDYLGADAMKKWNELAQQYSELAGEKTKKIAFWTKRRLKELT
ncbi:MAG: HEAT repeat domain-containing protein [Candidatus Riflebacteria bacterium]|nr:HEAT repeat domain-containing protein [Candidatus Riflebacteria bacterium]